MPIDLSKSGNRFAKVACNTSEISFILHDKTKYRILNLGVNSSGGSAANDIFLGLVSGFDADWGEGENEYALKPITTWFGSGLELWGPATIYAKAATGETMLGIQQIGANL